MSNKTGIEINTDGDYVWYWRGRRSKESYFSVREAEKGLGFFLLKGVESLEELRAIKVLDRPKMTFRILKDTK